MFYLVVFYENTIFVQKLRKQPAQEGLATIRQISQLFT